MNQLFVTVLSLKSLELLSMLPYYSRSESCRATPNETTMNRLRNVAFDGFNAATLAPAACAFGHSVTERRSRRFGRAAAQGRRSTLPLQALPV